MKVYDVQTTSKKDHMDFWPCELKTTYDVMTYFNVQFLKVEDKNICTTHNITFEILFSAFLIKYKMSGAI